MPSDNTPVRPMLPLRSASIIGTGSYAPDSVMTNADLEKLVETSDEWIQSRTGIRERHIAGPEQPTSELAARAAQAAIENAGISPEEIDLIICATCTPDMFFPSTACLVQTKIGAVNAACFDISAACSGFLFGVETARQYIASGTYKTVLVIGADKLSGIVDWTDRNTCVLFGDGAGAAILRHREGSRGILSSRMGSNGKLAEILYIPGGGSAHPANSPTYAENPATMRMNGRETYKHAVTAMVSASQQALADADVSADEIACFIPHQANLRIIEAIADRLDVSMDRFMVNLDRYGNTSAAAVAIALDEAARSGRFQRGDKILMVVFGGGLTWASTVVEW
ncbi:MAG: ketoacyl-ACP synthase III [Chthoniobacterales bacterium]|nr:ketoacyl-ACP synthase III [Chthoniobacterales bacterium]